MANATSSGNECVYGTVALISIAIAAVTIASAINPIAGAIVGALIVVGVIGWAVWRLCKK